MIIDDTQSIRETLEEIVTERSESDSRNYHLLNLLNTDNPVLPFDKAGIDYPVQSPFDICATLTDKQRMLASVLALKASLPEDRNGSFLDDTDLIHMYYQNMRKLDASLFQNDPYLQKISLPLGKQGNFLFGFQNYEKDKLFHYGETEPYGYGDILKLAWFDENVKYPFVTENGTYFSSVSADLIVTAQAFIRPVSQSVLILGCGIGYLPYLIHRKDSVSSVTIVEKDPDVIALFQNSILPQFDHPEKIHIIASDAFEYLRKEETEEKWIITDLYSSSLEGVRPYLEMKKLEHLHKRSRYLYWIEENILSNLKSAFVVMTISSLMPDVKEKDLMQSEEEGKDIIDALKPFMEDLHIHTNTQLKELFTSKGLKRYLSKQGNKLV